ncbi:MAG: MFS transporter [Deltaproteobacteria bacterium]|nr:MFS transporter [Deltaproteobacteria bacterium]
MSDWRVTKGEGSLNRSSEGGALPRGEGVAFAALRHREYRRYFITNMLSMMADNIEHVISYWVIFQAFHSPVLGGFAVISHWTPFLLFSVYFGGLADRYDCRRIIQAAQVLYMGVSLAWGILFLTGTIQVWHACALLVIHGLAGVLWQPASQLLIHDIVGSEHLQSAVRLNATGRQLGILFGPAVGGGLLLSLGPPLGLLVNAAIYLPLTLWLLWAPFTGHRREGTVGRGARGLGLRDGWDTLREVSGNRAIITMVALGGLSSLFVGNAFQAQMPEFASDLGTEKVDFAYSALLAANAAGAVVGGLLLEGRGWLDARVGTAIWCAIIWCLVITGFAVTTAYPMALSLLFLAGLFNLAFLSMAQTLVQLLAPAHLRGRLIGLFAMSTLGLRAFSGVTVGVFGGVVGVHWSLALSAMALLSVAIGLLAFTMRGVSE